MTDFPHYKEEWEVLSTVLWQEKTKQNKKSEGLIDIGTTVHLQASKIKLLVVISRIKL